MNCIIVNSTTSSFIFIMSLLTINGFRLQLQTNNPGLTLNWLFLPGGPGFGSESFSDLAQQLNLPGKTWYVDYPNDGSNQLEEDYKFDNWNEGLVNLISNFEQVILVAHSFSGMFVLSEPRIKNIIDGLVLMNTSPNNTWLEHIAEQAQLHHLPDLTETSTLYANNKSNETFKELSKACAPYFFSKTSLKEGMRLLENLSYSYASYDWANVSFHPNYEAAFIPEDLPTLIIGSEFDCITPFKLFSANDAWRKDSIILYEIPGGDHFPWLVNMKDVYKAFKEYLNSII